MKTVRRAVIDVGTNSIKLLVADVAGDQIQPVWEGSKQTRLGSGFYPNRRLLTTAITQSAGVVAEFAAEARKQEAASIRIIATSAAREAINAKELIDAIEREARLKVEILSGEEEADLVFEGVSTDSAMAKDPLLLLDVGGGSTEFILGQGHHKTFRASFPLGSVRLLETLPLSDPPSHKELIACRTEVREFLRTLVQPSLAPNLIAAAPFTPLLVGTGGTVTILARMEAQMQDFDRQEIEKMRLSLDRLKWHVQHLWSLPLEQRKTVIGLPANRADVILTGSVIFEAVMESFRFSELRVSTRGLRFAALRPSAMANAKASNAF